MQCWDRLCFASNNLDKRRLCDLQVLCYKANACFFRGGGDWQLQMSFGRVICVFVFFWCLYIKTYIKPGHECQNGERKMNTGILSLLINKTSLVSSLLLAKCSLPLLVNKLRYQSNSSLQFLVRIVAGCVNISGGQTGFIIAAVLVAVCVKVESGRVK